jgi:CheY-like chemotaxis protein
VLIADDTGASRELLAGILRNFVGQLNLREARNGTGRPALWRDFNPRITLLDIDMPGLDGLEALQQIRTRTPTPSSRWSRQAAAIENVKKALALGAAGYVVKPYKPQRIVDLLAKYRDADRSRPAA